MDIIKPMLAKPAELPRNEKDYGFEVKWDGMRAILYCQNGHIKILSRNQNDISFQYPELQEIAATVKNSFILDGEIVYFDQRGKPSFTGLQHRMNLHSERNIVLKSQKYPIIYIIFDLLLLRDKLILNLSYMNRRSLLEKLNFDGPFWQTPGYKVGVGSKMLSAVQEMGLEGIMAKRLTSVYTPDQRNGDWLKIKMKQRQEFVIGGWIPGNGHRSKKIGSLLLGYYDSNQFIYAGKVGTGFTEETFRELGKLLDDLAVTQNPFHNKIPHKEAFFVKPILICEIEFSEWINGMLRHPSFKGLRTDKAAIDVIRE